MGTLYVVATPIGNLEDITLRALRVLREVQLIAAEDTRRTAKLLQHYSIGTPSTSLHEHNESRKTAGLVARLQAGDDIALVSDAGTPLISDPGATLVRAARAAGLPVVAIPGPSAILAALSAAGLETEGFSFAGFPPRKSSALKTWLENRVRRAGETVVFFEAPHRIRQVLSVMLSVLGDKPIIVGRELTKVHEELVVSPISQHLERLSEPRGEFTVVIPAESFQANAPTRPDDAALVIEVGQLTATGRLSRRAAARRVAERYGLSVNEVYRLAREEQP